MFNQPVTSNQPAKAIVSNQPATDPDAEISSPHARAIANNIELLKQWLLRRRNAPSGMRFQPKKARRVLAAERMLAVQHARFDRAMKAVQP